MKPAPFTYHRPATLDAALELVAAHRDDAKVLAGGQSLVPLLALRLATPAHLVDLAALTSLGAIDVVNDDHGRPVRLRMGANVTQRQAERDPRVRMLVPLLADALPLIAHPAIRNRGTVCGSLAHADPAAELPTIALALDADLVVASSAGERRVRAGDFFRSYLETALGADDVLVAVEWPVAGARSGCAFHEVSRRHGDFAMVGAAATVTLDDADRVIDARVALAGVSTTPVRVHDAEAALVGLPVDTAATSGVEAAIATVDAAIDPPSDIHATAAYRRRVAGGLTGRALRAAIAAARSTTGGSGVRTTDAVEGPR